MSKAITERSAVQLATAIRSRELTAAEVVEAHIERHQQVAPMINALAAERFDLARREAAAADDLVRGASSPADLPPLLGVPFTVKESIALAGMPQCAGLVARKHVRSTLNTAPVTRLLEAGAIPLGVTNTSEMTLWIESHNRVYGRTNNPFDPTRVAGGSSGGEGAAVGSGGSPFGLASDIGGSIRIPAMFCGVFGHKPSSGVVPTTGNYPPTTGENARFLGIGPIARRAEDLIAVLRIIAGPDGQDRYARSVTLGDPGKVSLAGLRVILADHTTIRPISRELLNARERAAGALVAAGARIEHVSLRSWRGAVIPFLTTLKRCSERTTLELVAEAAATPPAILSLLRPGGPHMLPTKVTLLSDIVPRKAGSRSEERLLARARSLAAELLETIGDGVLLHPAHPRVAPRHGGTLGRLWLLNSAAVFNLAGVPVTEVPLGRSRSGLPLGVQVAAGIDRDHVSIAVALYLERAFGGWHTPNVSHTGC
jgi:Asp-tRNA(Asn)/Glu-tRNA(Gln) amidotransferase A subunit family amidase